MNVSAVIWGWASGEPLGIDIFFGKEDSVVVTITMEQAKELQKALDVALQDEDVDWEQ